MYSFSYKKYNICHFQSQNIVYLFTGTWDPKKVNADSLFRLFYLIHVAAMLEPESQVRGTVVLMDFHNMGWAQVSRFTSALLFIIKIITRVTRSGQKTQILLSSSCNVSQLLKVGHELGVLLSVLREL